MDWRYKSVNEKAEEFGVTRRTVQKWAKEGQLPGSKKVGRVWLIPENASKPSDIYDRSGMFAPEYQVYDRIPTPLKNSPYPVGKCREYIDRIADCDDRAIAWCEYFYFSGQEEKALQIAKQYLDDRNPCLKYAARILYFFASLSKGYTHLARHALDSIREDMRNSFKHHRPPEMHAISIYTVAATSVLLHSPMPEMPPLEEYIKYLPEGHKLFAYYVLAHEAYLKGAYERSIGIVRTALSIHRELYPIGTIYLHLMAAINYMNLKKVDKAKKHLRLAWRLAEPDGLIKGFGEHQPLLQGLIEVMFKKSDPAAYKKIIEISSDFTEGWTKMHNKDNGRQIADDLTTMEFTIAMLYNKGWRMNEIGEHIGLSSRTVGNYIQKIYAKLGIKSKKELDEYMIK